MCGMRDMFGNEVTIAEARRLLGKDKRRKPTQRNGYVDFPGGGPQGETCGSCKHKVIGGGGRYRKCGLNRARWTHGLGTDILASAPACKRWELAE